MQSGALNVKGRHARAALLITVLLVAATGFFVLTAEPEYATWYFGIAAIAGVALAVARFGRGTATPGIVLAISLVAAALAIWHALAGVDPVFFGVSLLLVAVPCVVSSVLALRWMRETGNPRDRTP